MSVQGVWQYGSLESKTFIFQQLWNLRRAWLPGHTCHGSWLVLLGSAPWPSVAILLTRSTFTNVFVLPWLWALLSWGAGDGAGRFGVLLCAGLFPALFLQRPRVSADRLAQPQLCAAAAQPWLPPSGPLAWLDHLPLDWWDCPVGFPLPGWFHAFLPSQWWATAGGMSLADSALFWAVGFF